MTGQLCLVVRASGGCTTAALVLGLGILGPVLKVTGGGSCSWKDQGCLGAAGQCEAPVGLAPRVVLGDVLQVEAQSCLQQSLEGQKREVWPGLDWGLLSAPNPGAGDPAGSQVRSVRFLLALPLAWARAGACSSASSTGQRRCLPGGPLWG